MKFDLVDTLKVVGKKTAFALKDKSPELCFIGGVGALIAAGYFVWNGKAKCEEILEEHKKNMDRVKETEEAVRNGDIDPQEYTPKQAAADKRHYCMKTAIAFVKVFAPIVILTITSIGLFGKSTAIYKSRYLASVAVCAEQSKYIKQLEEQIGEEKLEDLKIKSPDEPEDGERDPLIPPNSFWFDERSCNFVPGDPVANRTFLINMQNYYDDEVHHGVPVLGNDVIRALDIKTGNDPKAPQGTQKGQIMGWTNSKNPADGAAGFVDFGCFDIHKNVDFGEPILLTFNWDKTPIISRCGMSK